MTLSEIALIPVWSSALLFAIKGLHADTVGEASLFFIPAFSLAGLAHFFS